MIFDLKNTSIESECYSVTKFGPVQKTGRCWVSIDKNHNPIAIKFMGNFRLYLCDDAEVLKRAKRKRLCKESVRVCGEMNREAFLNWRSQAKKELFEKGNKVYSGELTYNKEFIVSKESKEEELGDNFNI